MASTLLRNIKDCMYINKMTQKDLAKAAGLSEVTISRYLSGKRKISPKALDKIAMALQAKPEALLGYPDGIDKDAVSYFNSFKADIEAAAEQFTPEQKAELVLALFKAGEKKEYVNGNEADLLSNPDKAGTSGDGRGV